ncbi:MAG: adenylate/guanylate cyclase domain-containing protein [Brevinematales bacterium]
MAGKTKKFVTLRFSISSAFVGVVVASCLLLGIWTFVDVHDLIHRSVEERLHDDISIGAMQIDGDLHSKLLRPSDENSPVYMKVKHTLQSISNRGIGIRDVYTMRKLDNGSIVFVVDAEYDPKEMSHIGDVYTNATAELLASFEKPYKVHVEKKFSTDQWGTWLSSYAPILTKDGRLDGILGIDVSAQRIKYYEDNYFLYTLRVIIIIAIVVIFLAIMFSRAISRPMIKLENDLSKVQKFDLGSKIEIKSNIREVNNMKDAIENMKNGLRSFKKFVPADLVAELIKLNKEAVLSAEKRMMTVSFSDIENFTGISESLKPEELVENLGVYFEGMTSTVLKNRGTIDKYIGDAIMSFWGAPNYFEDHAFYACISALESQRFLARIAEEWKGKGIPLFNTRIGINTGELIVGNMGYEERLNYTVMGDTVNLASRLEGLNKFYGTKIMISEFTNEAVKGKMETRGVDIVAVKGKIRGVKIFELISEKDNIDSGMSEFLKIYNDGVSLYEKHDWPGAVKAFSEALGLRPGDRPAQMILERCSKFEKDGTPADWNGVTVFHEK